MMQSKPSVAQVPQCSVHQMDFDFLCLDTNCTEKPDCCIICIKELHNSCQDGLIVEKEYLPELLEQDSSQKIEEYTEYKKQIYKEFLRSFDDKIKKLQDKFKEISENQTNLEFNEETIMLLKIFFKIKRNSAGELEFEMNTSNVEKSRQNFKEELEKLSQNFTDGIKYLKIENLSDMTPEQFHCHPNITVNKDGFNSLIFSRNPKSQEYNYFCAIDKKPLKQSTKILITIQGIQQSDPYLDIGVINNDKFQQLLTDNSPRISFNTAKSSFCGTSICNIQGSYSGSNFIGRKITFMYSRNKNTISFTSSDNLVTLASSDLGSQDLYFYLTLYHPVTKCSIRKILV